MSSSLGPAPNPPQSLLPHLDHLLQLLASPAQDSNPPVAETFQAEIAATAGAMRRQLAESTAWASTLKGADVAEGDVEEVINVLSQRVKAQRKVLETLKEAADGANASSVVVEPASLAAEDHEMKPAA